VMLSGAQKGSRDISSNRSRALSTSPQWTHAASAAFITGSVRWPPLGLGLLQQIKHLHRGSHGLVQDSGFKQAGNTGTEAHNASYGCLIAAVRPGKKSEALLRQVSVWKPEAGLPCPTCRLRLSSAILA